MAKKEKWITYPGENTADIRKFSTDPLKFGIEILEWFSKEDEAEEWKEIYEQDNSKRIMDCVEDITNGEIDYDRYEGGFFREYDGAYIKEC